ncbi:hypothetical protein ACFX13_018881 [Malus domestica]
MCFRVECKQCGKASWGGCGKHLKDLYAGIEQGKHCMCRSWPGVAVPNQHQGKTATQQQSLASASGYGQEAFDQLQPAFLFFSCLDLNNVNNN